jgi:hypothetical protein
MLGQHKCPMLLLLSIYPGWVKGLGRWTGYGASTSGPQPVGTCCCGTWLLVKRLLLVAWQLLVQLKIPVPATSSQSTPTFAPT